MAKALKNRIKAPKAGILEAKQTILHRRKRDEPKKTECTCEVISVDDDPAKKAGWLCKCFKLTNPNRKLASFRGPGFTNWVGGSGGGGSPASNPTENVVDPVSGEAFVVEYKCKCANDVV